MSSQLLNDLCYCTACNKDINPILVLEAQENSQKPNIVRCPECRLAFVYPQPDEDTIKNYYVGMYSDLAVKYSEQKMTWARKSVKTYNSIIQRKTNNKLEHGKTTLLDLGGGLGYYSKAFQELGFQVTLVEPDPISADFALNQLGIGNVVCKSFEEYFKNNSNNFDIVFLRHVIEHAKEPCKLIQEISNVLPNDGQLIIETDNNSGIELMLRPSTANFYLNLYKKYYKNSNFFNLLTKRPFAVDSPRHLYGFSSGNLARILSRYKMKSYKKVFYRTGHPIYWPNLPFPTLNIIISYLIKKEMRKFIISLIDICIYPLVYLTQFTGHSAGICLYAIKKDE